MASKANIIGTWKKLFH